MIIKEHDNNLIITDNVLTNLPISQLSSINIDTTGLSSDDLMLVSKKCNPDEMTETGFMTYHTTLQSLSEYIHSALNIAGINLDIEQISSDLAQIYPYKDLLQEISSTTTSAYVNITDSTGRYNPYVISAIYTEKGQLLSSLGGYKFADAMASIFDWKKFNGISANTISANNSEFNKSIVNELSIITKIYGDIVSNSSNFENITINNQLSAVKGKFTNLTATNLTATNNITTKDLTVTNDVAISSDLLANNIKAVTKIEAPTGNITTLSSTTANITNLNVNGQPYKFLKVMSQSAYNSSATKDNNTIYFTY